MKVAGWFVAVVMLVLYVMLWFNRKDKIIEYQTVTKTDTILVDRYIRDTVFKVRTLEKTRIDTVKIALKDSTYIRVPLPIETRLFSGQNIKQGYSYDIEAEGYNVKINSVLLKFKQPVINNTVTTTVSKSLPRLSYGMQVGVGYGVFSHRPDLYVGAGITYRIGK